MATVSRLQKIKGIRGTGGRLSGWICSAGCSRNSVHIDLGPENIFAQKIFVSLREIEVLDVSSKFDLIIEEAKSGFALSC